MIKKISLPLILFTLVAIILISCAKDVGKPDVPVIAAGSVDTCTTNITYSKQISAMIALNCALSGCHVVGGAGMGSPDFSTYAAFKAEIDAKGKTYVLGRAKPGGAMPPSYTAGPKNLNSCDLQKLETWLNDGYPNN